MKIMKNTSIYHDFGDNEEEVGENFRMAEKIPISIITLAVLIISITG